LHLSLLRTNFVEPIVPALERSLEFQRSNPGSKTGDPIQALSFFVAEKTARVLPINFDFES
jgi:hypothetical protein